MEKIFATRVLKICFPVLFLDVLLFELKHLTCYLLTLMMFMIFVKEELQVTLFARGCPFPGCLLKMLFFLVELHWRLCQKSVDAVWVGLLLGCVPVPSFCPFSPVWAPGAFYRRSEW